MLMRSLSTPRGLLTLPHPVARELWSTAEQVEDPLLLAIEKHRKLSQFTAFLQIPGPFPLGKLLRFERFS